MINRSISFSVIILGLTAIVAQIVFIRELISIFYGNELSLGTFLGAWLLWTALGSRYLPKIFSSYNLSQSIGLIQWSVCILLPSSLYLIKLSPSIIGTSTGEMIGYMPMLLITVISLAPFCLINGLLYTLSCRRFEQSSSDASSSIAKVYFLESLGSGIGGLAISFLLLPLIQPAQILLFLAVLNFLSGMVIGNFNPFQKIVYRKGWIILLVVLFSSLCVYIAPIYQNLCNNQQWQGFQLVTSR